MRSIRVVFLLFLGACAASVDPGPTTMGSPATTSTTVPRSITSTSGASSTTSTTVGLPPSTLPPLVGLAYEKVADLPFPVQMTALPGAEMSYIATKDGRVWAYDGSAVLEKPVLDISGQVRNRGEQGLLSIALDPDGSRLFAHYSALDGDTVVSGFVMSSPMEADAGSEMVLLRLGQPAGNHNGGMILYQAGNLYLGLGDGGGANDQFGNGQNRDTLLGGIVKIFLDTDQEPVLWQYGLRNPWRFWFDSDLIYVADVGQNSYEEVSVAPNGKDINYGWPITEGLHCFRPSSGCDTTGLTLPVLEVAHGDAGTCSITGGIVYRGLEIPEIDGHYFYSDYCGGYLRSFRYDGAGVTEQADWTPQVGVPGPVVGFGIDGRAEMYVATTEALYRVVPVRG